MNIQGKDTLREMLAAEYALGTLRGGARRRFERWARSDDGLRVLALQWSERLAPLVDAVPSVTPPRRVWEAIEARLPGFAARHGQASLPPLSWWDRVGLWRGLSAAFAVVAVVALGLASRPVPIVAPQVVRVQTVPAAVAALLDPKTGTPVAVVVASENGDAATIKVAADVRVPAGKVLQLWIAPNDAEGLVSMGVLPDGVAAAPTPVATLDAATLARTKAFGLSLEPAGGSPQPTQVLGLGAFVRMSR